MGGDESTVGKEGASRTGAPEARAPRPRDGGEDLSLPARFAMVARSSPDRVAVCAPNGRRTTYGELDVRSGAIAAALADRGVQPSEPVAILLDHEPPLVAAIWGVLRAGAMYLYLDPADPASRHRAMVVDAGPRWLVTDGAHAARAAVLMDGRTPVVNMDDPGEGHGTVAAWDQVSPEAGAWLMYTSGSTGQPKGVWQSHRNVIHHAKVYTELAGISREDRLSMLASAGVAASATALFGATLNGAALAMFSIRREGVESLSRWLDEEGITICHLVPSVFRRLARAPGDTGRWPRMRLLRLGGEAVLLPDVELHRRVCSPDCVLMHALSSTETGLISQLTIGKSTPLPGSVVPAGRPVAGAEVLILDEACEPCRPGSEGRIAVRSRYLAMGYWRQPELTAQAFQAVPDQPGVRQFLSGDVGLIRHGLKREHHGRADRQVKIRGWRVDPGAVEAAIRATGRAAEAAVVAQNDGGGGVRLAAYVVPVRGQSSGVTEWRHVLREVVPMPMIPDTFEERESLPQTPSGKIDYVALAALPPSRWERRSRGRPPRDRMEKKVAAIWEAVLGVEGMGLEDDFFELGGDSLRGADVLLEVERTLHVSLPPSTLAEHPSLGAFAAAVASGAMPKTQSPLVALQAGGSRWPLFLVHPGNGNPACFGPLARLLGPQQPVYAFRAPGLHGECWPLMSVRAMAKRYLREVLNVAPEGPYLLGGRCAGGLIALEMARHLAKTRKQVAMVVLIDTPHPLLRRRRSGWRRRIMDGVRDGVRLARWGFLRAIRVADRPAWLPGYRRFVGQMIARALRAYRPGFYDGDLTLFVASDHGPAFKERLLMMQEASRQSRVITIPGDHDNMLRAPAVQEVAQRLQACLDLVRDECARVRLAPGQEAVRTAEK